MIEILRIQTGKVSYNRTSEKRYENLQKSLTNFRRQTELARRAPGTYIEPFS